MNARKLYKKLPRFAQDWAISFENIRVYYKKYRAFPLINPISKVCKKLKLNSSFVYNDKYELKRVEALIDHAVNHTKYYKKTFGDILVFKTLKEFKARIPILKKQTIRFNSTDFISAKASRTSSTTFRTSGSTGSPMEGRIKISELQTRFTIMLKSMTDFGIDLGKPYGRFPGADIADDVRVYRKDYFNNHYVFSIFHLSDVNIKKYFDAFQSYNIETLEGYPSVMYTLAKLFEQNQLVPTKINFVCTTAEKLHAFQKEKIESVFNCKVFDYYGSSEQSSFVYTCPEGRMHNSNIISTLEILDKNGNEVKKGEEGRMIVTSFTSSYTPLIRYEIGDRCILSKNQSCPCGTGGLIIDEIIGRDEDVFKTVSGKYITRFSLVLKYLPSQVVSSQLVLSNKKMSVDLNYTNKNGEIDRIEFSEFENKLQNMIGNEYAVNIIWVDSISKSLRGKVRAVIIEE